MTIRLQILGDPGWDNAAFMTVDSGQSRHRLLCDCGEGVLSSLEAKDLQQIEAVFFSHFHFDHFAGFDSLLRYNWCRPEMPMRVFGPAGSRSVLHHRLRGFLWNNAAGLPGEYVVTELVDEQLRSSQYLTTEGFAVDHPVGESEFDGVMYDGGTFTVQACPLNHGTISLAYIVREHDQQNVDEAVLARNGLPPGAWIRTIKDRKTPDGAEVDIDGTIYRAGDLRDRLLHTRPGESVAYLTDFWLDDRESEDRLVEMLHGCRTMICENNYRDAEAEQARKNYHMTSSEVGRLARRVDPEQLILFHVSDRYGPPEWREQLAEVRRQFPQTIFPDEWCEAIGE